MGMIEDIKRDRERPQIKLMSMGDWSVKKDDPYPGWVKVIGPCIPVKCPTVATDLNGEDWVARNAEAKRIARVPAMEASLINIFESLDLLDGSVNVERRGAVHLIRERLAAATGAV